MAPLRHAVHVLPDVLHRGAPGRTTPPTRRSSRPSSRGSPCWPTTWRGGCAPSRRRGPPTARPRSHGRSASAPARLGRIASTSSSAGLDDAQLESQSYAAEWTVADVLSHLGSGAVHHASAASQDVRAAPRRPTDFAPSVWDEWNAKAPRAQADDCLAADERLLAALEAVGRGRPGTPDLLLGAPVPRLRRGARPAPQRARLPHAGTSRSCSTTRRALPPDAAAVVVDNLGMIARFTARPTGRSATVAVRTTDPERHFTLRLTRRRRRAPGRRRGAAMPDADTARPSRSAAWSTGGWTRTTVRPSTPTARCSTSSAGCSPAPERAR